MQRTTTAKRRTVRPPKSGKALVDVSTAQSLAIIGGAGALGAATFIALLKRTGFDSPKFIIAVALSVLSTLVWFFGCATECVVSAHLSAADWMSFQEWIYGTYATAEVLTHGATKLATRR